MISCENVKMFIVINEVYSFPLLTQDLANHGILRKGVERLLSQKLVRESIAADLYVNMEWSVFDAPPPHTLFTRRCALVFFVYMHY